MKHTTWHRVGGFSTCQLLIIIFSLQGFDFLSLVFLEVFSVRGMLLYLKGNRLKQLYCRFQVFGRAVRICSVYKQGDLFPEVGWLAVIAIQGRFFFRNTVFLTVVLQSVFGWNTKKYLKMRGGVKDYLELWYGIFYLECVCVQEGRRCRLAILGQEINVTR